MPDHILQLKDGLVISYDVGTDGLPTHIKKWADTDISIKSLTEEQILEFSAKVGSTAVKDFE